MWLLTLKSILVAVDFDPASAPALRTGARLSSLAGANLHLLNVSDDPGQHADGQLREHLRTVAPDAPDPESARVISGSPAATIVEHAVRVGADAVIVGPHRERSTGPGEMGSTAATVVRTAGCPCLVAATELVLPLKRIVVPIDLTEASRGALSVALSWASALRTPGGTAHILAMHVTNDASLPAAEARLREEVERARTSGFGAAHVSIEEAVHAGDDAAQSILAGDVTAGADLLVLGTRRSDGAAGDLGSVSAAVARATKCPLLLVPPGTWQERAGRSP